MFDHVEMVRALRLGGAARVLSAFSVGSCGTQRDSASVGALTARSRCAYSRPPLEPVAGMLCCTIASWPPTLSGSNLENIAGQKVLRLVCRLSLELDSWVRRTENAFIRYGMRPLLVSKFIPGLNPVAAPIGQFFQGVVSAIRAL